jgi:hypothetical protein
MPENLNILQVARVNAVMQGLVDVRTLPQELVWNRRVPDTPATDAEILARWTQRILIADLIADDQKAVAYSSGKLSYESYTIPNLKHGSILTQEQINQLNALRAGGMLQGDGADYFNNTERATINALRLGVEQRKEALKLAMLLDGFSYDRLGIKMSGVTWGMPTDLKVTLTGGDTWDNPTTAKVVTQIQTLLRRARVRYGIYFDRLSMSLTAFNLLIGTDEFALKAKSIPLLSLVGGLQVLSIQNTEAMLPIAASVLGVREIEIYEARYWSQEETGVLTSAPYLPINKVLFTASGNDGNAMAYDFANCIVTESIVSQVAQTGMIGNFDSAVRGPVAYATAEHNPPQIAYWGVARGLPRKKLLQSSAVMTVGTFTDDIPTTDPF